MRTTLDIPQELIDELQKELGFKSKTDVIIYSLKEALKRCRREEIKNLAGKIVFENIDTAKNRRRPRGKS